LKTTETALWVKRENKHKHIDHKQNKCKISHHCKSLSDFNSNQLHHHQLQWFLKYFLYEDEYHLVNCFHLSAAQKLVKKYKDKDKTKHKSIDDFQILTELLKSKHKKHKVYNVKSNNFEIFDNNEKDENEKSENIATLSKNIVSKISEFNWIADSDVFLHMTDQLQLFNNSLIYIKRCIIKVEERKLYVNYYDTAIM